MHCRPTLTAVAVATVFVSTPPAFAQDDDGTILVTANRFGTREAEATYAAEVHTRKQIEQSGSATLFDYLGQHSSVQIAPSFGNRHAPKIDMRGYGINDGFQNIVVTIDGVRQNNIDLSTPLIGSIPMADIERIEITKGSGSVLFGDGATAGTIQIVTRKQAGGKIEASVGNHGAFGTTANAGLRAGKVDLDASASRSNVDGYNNEDATGHRDRSTQEQWRVRAAVTPADALRIKAGAGRVDLDTRYPGVLTLAQFDADPAQSNATPYTHQRFRSDRWNAGVEAWLSPAIKLIVDHHREDKSSEFVGSFIADYDYAGSDLALSYEAGGQSLIVGVQRFEGSRSDNFSTATTSKDNLAGYAQAQAQFGPLKVGAGVRREKVEYAYEPAGAAAARANHHLSAADLGINYRVSEQLSVFSNLNRAYQAPDIDRFFLFGGAFNAFIEPMKTTTLNLGSHLVAGSHQFKVSAFRTALRNEIYFLDTGSFFTSFNTNIDQSHKYGIEAHDVWRASDALTVIVNYAWTKAVIDSEDQGGGAFSGKELPGVSRHALTFGTRLRATSQTTLGGVWTWRSATWAMSDFDNNNAQKQRAYSSVDLNLNHRIRNDLEAFAAIENVFAHVNGVWADDNAIYPVNFTRNFRAGIRASF